MSRRIRTRLVTRCGYRVVDLSGRWGLVAVDGQIVRAFDTKQQAIDAGKTIAAKKRTRISWSNGGRVYGVDYSPKGTGRAAIQLLCALLGRWYRVSIHCGPAS